MTPPAGGLPAGKNKFRPILILGCGNPGRQDDGVGPALVERLELWARRRRKDLVFDAKYQLLAEEALAVAAARAVVFVDAARRGRKAFAFRPLTPGRHVAFSTHAMTPESIVSLAEELYNARPPAWLLTIRGYAWEPHARITPRARANLAAARRFLQRWLSATPAPQRRD